MKTKRFILVYILFFSYLNAIEVSKQWGENVSGVAIKFNTNKKEIALTFDACGSTPFSKGYDHELIDFLIENKIPATLFLNGGWINTNRDIFKKLQAIPYFELENHGIQHRPLSINGQMIYGRIGTKSKEEIITEVEDNNRLFLSLGAKKPHFFRSGTAYYDEIAVGIVKNDLGLKIAGFSVNGDYGATLKKDAIKDILLQATGGDIVIAHMNHPEGDTAEGFMEGLKILQAKGFNFVKLEDIKNNLISVP